MAREEVKLPALGESVTEGILTAWLVDVGDTVEVDQPIFEISTDKVDTEVPSPVAGTVLELRAEVDDEIEVGATVVVIDTEGGAAPAADDAPEAEPATAEAATAEEAPAPAPQQQAPAPQPAPAPARADLGDDAFDVLILGAGTGGYSAALRCAQLGLSVALVEKEKVGGTCLHWGCIPTKAVLQSAEVAEVVHDAGDYGVNVAFEGLEVAQINKHKDEVVDRMWKGLQGALKGRGVETVLGHGTIVDRNTISVELAEGGTREVKGRALIVATGSKPRELPFAPFDGDKVISSDHALYLEELPKRAVVLGSGAVGMEFATAWSAFGVEVTIVELLDRLLPLEDADSSKEIARAFRKRGVNTMVGAKLTSVDTSDGGVICTVETKKGEEKLEADLLLVAVGRAPVTEGFGLEGIGVQVDRGFIVVDEYCRTNVPGVFALGDVIPTLGLAHASFAEGFLVADQLGGLRTTPIDYAGVPRVTYSHPEVASVGYTEEQCKEMGQEVVVEKYPFQALGRAAMMKASGMLKVIAAKDPSQPHDAGRVLGIHIVGPRATDLIAEGELIYNWEALPTDVAQFIHAHPSFGEAMGEAHLALAGRALHG